MVKLNDPASAETAEDGVKEFTAKRPPRVSATDAPVTPERPDNVVVSPGKVLTPPSGAPSA
jgi:hypothetical protein